MKLPKRPVTERTALPKEIDQIAEAIPESPHGYARLKQLHGLLPNPLGPTFPNQGAGATTDQSVDPGLAATQLGNYGLNPYGAMFGGLGMTSGTEVTPGTIGDTTFADSIATVLLVSSLPTLPDPAYPDDQLVFNTTNNLLYKNVGGTWKTIVDAVDMTGQITTTQITSGAVTTPLLAANAVTTAKLAAGSVTANELAANSVIAGKISAGAVSTTELAANAVTAAKITAGTIDTTKLTVNGIDISQIALAGSVDGVSIASGAITAAKISANAVTAAAIQANTIDVTKLTSGTLSASNITTGTLTGTTISGNNIIAGGSGNDGFSVVNGSGTNIGSWTGSFGLVLVSNGISAPGNVRSTINGLTTVAVAGIGSYGGGGGGLIAGTLALDTSSSPHRLYTYDGSGWHYAVMDAGVTIPAHEGRCVACRGLLAPDDNLIVRGDRWQYDGALHGLWIHLACAGRPTDRHLADQYDKANFNPKLLVRLENAVRRLLRKRGVDAENPRR